MTDYVPSIIPSQNGIYWRNVVKSSSLVSNSISLKSGKLNTGENIADFIKRNTISTPIMNNDVECILDIDSKYLIQGEDYSFELSASNSNGVSNVSVSTRIDFSPRLSCSVENLKNENNFTTFESLAFISCLKLPYETISSFVMEFYSQNQRLGIISNTPKKALITRLPYSADGLITLVVKLQNLYGSIGIYQKELKVYPPNSLLNDDSLQSRISYTSKQLQTLRNSLPIRMELSNEINILLSLLLQNETVSSFSKRVSSELDSAVKTSLNNMIKESISLLKNLQSITYKVDEKVIQLVLPIVSKLYNILQVDTYLSSEIESWLDWIYSGMNKALDYYPTFIYQDLLDKFHLEELKSLHTILINSYKNDAIDQFKAHKYSLQYFKLAGSSIDNSTIVENVEYSELLNSKKISLSNIIHQVDMKLPADFSNQISRESKSKLFYSLSSIDESVTYSKLLPNRPIISLSLLDTSYTSISVNNIDPPIIFNFQGLITSNKTYINTSCIYFDSNIGMWSNSGIETVPTIKKRTDDFIYFDMECRSTHLSLFSIQELEYISNNPNPERSGSPTDSNNNLTIILATVIPIVLLILVLLIVVILSIIFWRNKKKKEKEMEMKKLETTNVELEGFSLTDFPSENSMFLKPLMSVSSNGTTSEAFNPLSRYSDLVRIGQGAFGSVFKAFDNKTSTIKAIKVIRYNSMEELNTLMKEGTQLMNIVHPHILKVNEFFVSQDHLLCIDMDFYELGDLVKLTNIDFDCSEYLVKQIIYQMAQALVYIHCSMKIIHRDIKPSNVFIKTLENDTIHIIIADFGLAKSNTGSTNNSYAGTPIFMSPELGLGGKYYYNTDIYSLGISIYQIMTKDTITSISQLYLSKDQKEATEILRTKLLDCNRYSIDLIEIVLKMLQKDNLVRPQAQDILEDAYFGKNE